MKTRILIIGVCCVALVGALVIAKPRQAKSISTPSAATLVLAKAQEAKPAPKPIERNPKTLLLPSNPDHNKPVDDETLKFRAQALAKPGWQIGIDWARGGSGTVDCPSAYAATYPECIFKGGRSCLMSKAIDSAKANNCSWAYQLTIITQCHNAGAATELATAGQQPVCDYEKSLQ